MSVLRLDEVPDGFAKSVVSIGVFDGVHIGHQALFSVLKAEARRLGGQAVALTFDQHPVGVLHPEREPLHINTLEQKLGLIRDTGIDAVIVGHFDETLAGLAPLEFVDGILIGKLKCAGVVVGSSFRFGKARSGDISMLTELGIERGFRVVGVEPTTFHGAPVSSTRVRHVIEHGDVESAKSLLGRPFTILGSVVKGLQLGRKLGFPTANVKPADRQIVPPDGVYAVEAVLDEATRLPAACSIGVRPTINGTERAIEVMIGGFDGDLYDREIGVAFHHRLRDQEKFDDLERLKEQIGKDVETVRQLMHGGQNDR